MRRIISKETEAKRQKRNQKMLGAFLLFIMFFSVVAYSFQTLTRDLENQNPEAKKIDYNGFEFTEQNGFWVLNKDGNSFIFKFNPNQVERINAELNSLESYYNKILHLNSESLEAESEIRVNLAGFVSKIEKSLNETCDGNTIVIKEGNESMIRREKNCVFIEGNAENLGKLADEFLFNILEVRN